LFVSHCGACHAVRGTAAAGTRGPDLTHVGSRLSIGAGLLPNNAGALAGWIASSQHLKPGNLMPSFAAFSGAELRELAAYLEGLK
jgi:cytochrome c oxidase subunit 2